VSAHKKKTGEGLRVTGGNDNCRLLGFSKAAIDVEFG
jgi:hypothetical protein